VRGGIGVTPILGPKLMRVLVNVYINGVNGSSNPDKRSGRACLRLFATANKLQGKIEGFAIIYWPG